MYTFCPIFFCDKQFFTAHGPPYYQEGIPIVMYSLNVGNEIYGKIALQSRLTLRYITSELTLSDLLCCYLCDIVIFYKSHGFNLFNFPVLCALVVWPRNDNTVFGKVNFRAVFCYGLHAYLFQE